MVHYQHKHKWKSLYETLWRGHLKVKAWVLPGGFWSSYPCGCAGWWACAGSPSTAVPPPPAGGRPPSSARWRGRWSWAPLQSCLRPGSSRLLSSETGREANMQLVHFFLKCFYNINYSQVRDYFFFPWQSVKDVEKSASFGRGLGCHACLGSGTGIET